MKKLMILIVIMTSTVAFLCVATAQQAQQQTPSQIALQLTSIIGQWAQALEALQSQNAELQKQLSAVTKERDDLKARAEPKK